MADKTYANTNYIKTTYMSRGPGHIQQKVLLLLKSGAALSFASFSPRAYFKTLRAMDREFEKLNRRQLKEAINALYRSKLVDYLEKANGEVSVISNDAGKKKILTYTAETLKIAKPQRWDKQWRIVLFDIPHSLKKVRDTFRFHLKRLGFFQLQRSVFVHPFPCHNEIEFLIELYDLRPFVRQMIVTKIDNERDLKERFNLV